MQNPRFRKGLHHNVPVTLNICTGQAVQNNTTTTGAKCSQNFILHIWFFSQDSNKKRGFVEDRCVNKGYTRVSHQNMFFRKKINPTHSRGIWVVGSKIPKGFLISTTFRGCTRPPKICPRRLPFEPHLAATGYHNSAAQLSPNREDINPATFWLFLCQYELVDRAELQQTGRQKGQWGPKMFACSGDRVKGNQTSTLSSSISEQSSGALSCRAL